MFDESLCFKTHFLNLRTRALKRLNILKIFSHKSWHLNKKTLTNIYSALIGSIFDYSFFTVASVAKSNLDLIQTVQNRSIRCIYKLKWDSPTKELFPLSRILPLKSRFYQLGARYLTKAIRLNNQYISRLVNDHFRSWSTITAKNNFLSTPLCWLFIGAALSMKKYSFLNLYFYLLNLSCNFIYFLSLYKCILF